MEREHVSCQVWPHVECLQWHFLIFMEIMYTSICTRAWPGVVVCAETAASQLTWGSYGRNVTCAMATGGCGLVGSVRHVHVL